VTDPSESPTVAWRIVNIPSLGHIVFQQRPEYFYEKDPSSVEELIVRPSAEKEVDWATLESLGWQRITCDVCGDMAVAAPTVKVDELFSDSEISRRLNEMNHDTLSPGVTYCLTAAEIRELIKRALK